MPNVLGTPEDLNASTIGDSTAAALRPAHALPDSIGPYRIIECIGEGGMGIVYKAEQREPVRRIVALKIIKLGMDTKEVVARFDVERQALALMSHPNVAKVFDAGMTETGRPYFAMEHVPGVSITSYCDTNKLTTRERLELFIPVCQAVQHAHQKGIIHRDLKPGNILVTMFDGKPVPKVIDFGVAKATNFHLTEKTLFTQTGSIIGTVEYMSPEQATGGGLDIDTRTDIYSLGVILYQLLTGSLPFQSEILRKAGMEGIARIIRDTDPPKPSARLTETLRTVRRTPGATEIAKLHHTDPRTLRRELRGDLDWIVLKAMEKDRTRRYETASALALDLQRHLADELVSASPPSTRYRIVKFVRRHRTTVSAAAAVLVALIAGLLLATLGFIRANAERNRAVLATRDAQNQKRIAQAEKTQAVEAARRAETASSFLQEVLWMLSSDTARLQPLQMLDDWAKRLQGGALSGEPAAESRVRATLARRFVALGSYQRAIPQLRTVVQLNRSLYDGANGQQLIVSLNDLAEALVTEGDFENAAPLVQEALQTRATGLEPTETARTLDLQGSLSAAKGDWASAEKLYQQAWDIRRQTRGDSSGLADSLGHHADVLLHRNPSDPEGQRVLQQAIAMYQRVLPNQLAALVGPLRRLARGAMLRGDWETADRILPQPKPLATAELGLLRDIVTVKTGLLASQPDARDVLKARAELYGQIGEFDKGAADFARLIELDPQGRDPDESLLWHKMLPLLLKSGQLDEYLRRRHEALMRFRDHTRDKRTMHRIAKASLCYPIDGDELQIAQMMADTALRLEPTQAFYYESEGMALYRSRRFKEAVDCLLKSRDHAFPFRDILADFYLAMCYFQLDKPTEASAAFDRASRIWDGYEIQAGTAALGQFYWDWVLCAIAHDEAKKLLKR